MKNVATARLAECCRGTGLNLIVDNDLASPPSLRCPTGTTANPGLVDVPFDSAVPTQPWENLQVRDAATFASFSRRVTDLLHVWGITPLLTSLWPVAVECQQRGEALATSLSACRIAQERKWHVRNLELPVSELCQTEPFLAFVTHICRNAERFFNAYNRGVREYRRKYRIRNAHHPVPDLKQQGNQLELPFWYWEPGDHDRARLFVQRGEQGIELWGKERLLAVLPETGDDFSPLQKLQQTGRLRTRALTTTLFARLCLGDLFLHGIGGARYDEITDGLMAEFFGIAPPPFLTLTATLHLPLGSTETTAADVSRLKSRIRHLKFSGDDDDQTPDVMALRQQRDDLIKIACIERGAELSRSQRQDRRAARRRRHLELVRIQEELAARAGLAVQRLQQQLDVAREQVRASAILRSREFSFALFPESKILQLVQDVQRQVCGR